MADPSCEEDDEEVHIVRGEKREEFCLADANNPVAVQRRFCLDHEPSCVYGGKGAAKRITFGDLRAGRTYKLKDDGKIPYQRIQTHNAAIMANATTKKDPTAYLTQSSQNHTIQKVCAISEHSKQGVILAVGRVEDQNVLYAAFKGTKTWKDAMADADIELIHRDDIPGGTFHSGFERRTKVLPLKHLMHCANKEDCKTIILCGHSLGGAVSSIAAIELMLTFRTEFNIQIYNITFGAPLFANHTVMRFCKDQGFDLNMLHFVGHQDIVPGILSLGHTISEFGRRTRTFANDIAGFLYPSLLAKPCIPFFSKSSKCHQTPFHGNLVVVVRSWKSAFGGNLSIPSFSFGHSR